MQVASPPLGASRVPRGLTCPLFPSCSYSPTLNSSQGTQRQASESVLGLVCVPLFSGRSQRDSDVTRTQPQGDDCPLLALKVEGPRSEEPRVAPGRQPVGKGAPRPDSCTGPNLANNLNRLGGQLLPQPADRSPDSLCP